MSKTDLLPVPLAPFASSRLRARLQSPTLSTHRRPPRASSPKAKAAKPTPNPAPNRFPDIHPRASVVECGMKFRSIGRAVINHQKTPERTTAPIPLPPSASPRLRARFHPHFTHPPKAKPITQSIFKSCKSCPKPIFSLPPSRLRVPARDSDPPPYAPTEGQPHPSPRLPIKTQTTTLITPQARLVAPRPRPAGEMPLRDTAGRHRLNPSLSALAR